MQSSNRSAAPNSDAVGTPSRNVMCLDYELGFPKYYIYLDILSVISLYISA